jgi:DNA recombination protein RmuC
MGGVMVWLVLQGTIVRVRADVASLREAEGTRVAELAEVRAESASRLALLQSEQLSRTRYEAEAQRLVSVETELQQVRARAEMLIAEKSALQSEADRVQGLENKIAGLSQELVEAKTENAELRVALQKHIQAENEKLAILTDVRSGIDHQLKNITADALRVNQTAFLQLANEAFEKHKVGADAALEARQKAVQDLVSPISEALSNYKQQIDEMEKLRATSHGMISAELKAVAEGQNAVRTETSKLVNALRAAPKTRGRWGENTLRNVLELSGLSSLCDFSSEESFARDGSVARPDVVIRLPGGRSIVVDAKTSLSAYLDAIDADDEAERDRHFTLHAAQIRAHARQLAGKAYWDRLTVTPDFVVMFVPGDNFYAAAAERDPSLFEDAAAQRVVIVTPATLIALAKAVAFGWRQEKVAENAKRVHDLGRELYVRMISMGAHIQSCGDALGKAVKNFNQFIGSVESSVMPQARRFRELEVEGTAGDLPVLEQIEMEPRLLRSDRDFKVDSERSESAASPN